MTTRRRLWLLAAVLAAATIAAVTAGPAASAEENRATWALLIGIDKYQRPEVPALIGAANDAKALRDALVRYGGVPAEHVFVLTSDAGDPNALPTRSNIAFRLSWLAERARPGDTLIVLFSGHGISRGGAAYLLTYEADVRSSVTTQMTCLSAGDLREALRAVPASRLLLLLDACRSDPTAAKDVDRPNALSDAFARAVKVVPRTGSAEQEVAATVYACRVGERAYEWPAEKQGFFAYYLVQGLSGAAADAEGQVTLSSLITYLETNVPAKTEEVLGKRQVPWQETEGVGAGGWVLARVTPRAPETAVRELPTTATLRVSSEPAGAAVRVDAELRGTTPCEIRIPLGAVEQQEVAVTLDKEGFVSRRASVTLYAGRVTDWGEVQLEPRAAPTPSPSAPPGTPGGPPPAHQPEPLPLPGAGRVSRGEQPPGDAQAGDVWVSPKDGAEMVYVPAGEFIMGRTPRPMSNDEDPVQSLFDALPYVDTGRRDESRKVDLDAYWIDRYEVTVAQYRRFCEETKREMPPAPNWGRQDDHPVVNVSWHDASAYAQWAGKRLPTGAEWEKAARGTDGRAYPWGNEWDPQMCASKVGSTLPVGSFASGASPYGAMDMAGNVAEWCADRYGRPHPDDRVVRGGGWADGASKAAAYSRDFMAPTMWLNDLGFRCVRASG